MLDSYLDKIPDEQDNILFKEAVNSAKGGALRAAYIMIWISCAESLKRRFNVAQFRDHNATIVVGKIQQMEANHLSVDMKLLEEGHKYGFVSDTDFYRLKHVYEMRCVYGHPYEEKPTEEELKSAASTVVDLLLSKPVMLGKGFLSEQLKRLTEDKNYIDDTQEAISDYVKEIFPKIDENLHEWFIDKLWQKAEPFANDKTALIFWKRAFSFSRYYLAKIEKHNLQKWDFVSKLTKWPNISSYSLCMSDTFPHLVGQVQDIVLGNLLDRGENYSYSLRMIDGLDISGNLSPRHQDRFCETLNNLTLKHLASSGIRTYLFVDRIISALKSHDWYTQNPATQVIENIGPKEISKLPDNTQILLGNNVLQSAEGGAGTPRSLIDNIAGEGPLWPEKFIEGMLVECFVNEKDEIRFKKDKLREVLIASGKCGQECKSDVINRLVIRVQGGSIRYGRIFDSDLQEVVDVFESLINSEQNVYGFLTSLKEALEAVESNNE